MVPKMIKKNAFRPKYGIKLSEIFQSYYSNLKYAKLRDLLAIDDFSFGIFLNINC